MNEGSSSSISSEESQPEPIRKKKLTDQSSIYIKKQNISTVSRPKEHSSIKESTSLPKNMRVGNSSTKCYQIISEHIQKSNTSSIKSCRYH